MEERGAVGAKDKKYVLYSVVGDERGKTSPGVWAVRIILGVLLVIALAVVPYISLRMAQVSDRTLVVFQPVLVRNQSKSQHTTPRESLSAMRSVHNSNILQSASHKKDIVNVTTPQDGTSAKNFGNGTILTVHETAVTFSLVENITNRTKDDKANATTEKVKEELIDDLNNTTPIRSSTIENDNDMMESSSTNFQEEKTMPTILSSTMKSTNNMSARTADSSSPFLATFSTDKISKYTTATFSTESTPSSLKLTESTSKSLQEIIRSLTRQLPSQLPAHNVMNHKLAYVAVASSGNHVGGFCIWKTNRNITDWSYFFDNIPMEYQGHKDNTDREFRGLLVAVRMWENKWSDYHVVLRSQSNAIEGSKHLTRMALLKELEEKSDNQFTYELEWRLRKDDSLVAIAYSLARLYKDFNYWFNDFEQRLKTVVGEVKGPLSKMRVSIPQEAFAANSVESQVQMGGFDSLKISSI